MERERQRLLRERYAQERAKKGKVVAVTNICTPGPTKKTFTVAVTATVQFEGDRDGDLVEAPKEQLKATSVPAQAQPLVRLARDAGGR